MWKVLVFFIPFVLTVLISKTAATWCFQCDSWQHSGCGEEDYLYDKEREFLVSCSPTSYSVSSGQYQASPHTCLKEITHFLPDKNSPALDPYHRYSRPHVSRHCGISLNPNYNRGEDYYDRCIKTETVVNGIRAERWICSCSGDGCNSAMSFNSFGPWSWTMFLTVAVIFLRGFTPL